MTKFWDFVEFMLIRELKQEDVIIRNYMIECSYDKRLIHPHLRGDFTRLGLQRLGFEVRGNSAASAFGEVIAALRSKGCMVNEHILMGHIAHWYNYDRIKCGELKRWPKRDKVAIPA